MEEKIIQRNYIIQNPNEKHAVEQRVRNSSSQKSDLLTATCKTMSYPQSKKHGQRDMQSKLLTHDLGSMDIIPKGHDDLNFNKEAKSKYVCDEKNGQILTKNIVGIVYHKR